MPQPEPSQELATRKAEVAVRDEALRVLRSALLGLDDRRAQLVAEDDIDTLAAGAQDLDTLMNDLHLIQRQVRLDLADMVDRRDGSNFGLKRFEVEGVGVIESKGGWRRTQWRSEALLEELIRRAIANVEDEIIVSTDGEPIPLTHSHVVEAIIDVLVTTLPLTGSLSWRTGQVKDGEPTGLKKWGIHDEDWCQREEQPRLASVPRRY